MGNAASADLHPKPTRSFRARTEWGGAATVLALVLGIGLGLAVSLSWGVDVQPHVVVDGHESKSEATRFHVVVDMRFRRQLAAEQAKPANHAELCHHIRVFAVDVLMRPVPESGVVEWTGVNAKGDGCVVHAVVRSAYGRGSFRVAAPASLGPDHDVVSLSVSLDDDASGSAVEHLPRVSHLVPHEALVFSTLSSSAYSGSAATTPTTTPTPTTPPNGNTPGTWSYFIQLVPTDWSSRRATQIAATRHFVRWEEAFPMLETQVVFHYETSPLKMVFVTPRSWATVVAVVGGTFAVVGHLAQECGRRLGWHRRVEGKNHLLR